MTWKQTIVAAIVLGAVAGLVVMWLERFEVAKMHDGFRDMLKNHDEFRKLYPEPSDVDGDD